METKIFKCETDGKVIEVIKDGEGELICDGKPMTEVLPGTVDASSEKHVPVIEKDGNKVTVTIGTLIHPMEESHHIEWIAIETKEGNQRKFLKPGDEPKAVFMLSDTDEIVAATEFCNLHGLWKAQA